MLAGYSPICYSYSTPQKPEPHLPGLQPVFPVKQAGDSPVLFLKLEDFLLDLIADIPNFFQLLLMCAGKP